MLLSITYEDFQNAFSHVLLWVLNKIAELLNQVLGYLPDDPKFLNQLDFSSIQKYMNFIHYFIPLKFIFMVIYTSVLLFFTIEICFLIYKILSKAADKILSSWEMFFMP